jgi:hypothetical protein
MQSKGKEVEEWPCQGIVWELSTKRKFSEDWRETGLLGPTD